MLTESEDVTKRTTVEELVRTYIKAENDIRAACALVSGSLASLNNVLKLAETSGDVRFGSHRCDIDWDHPEDQVIELRRSVWGRIVDRLELRRMMSVKRAKELDKWLNSTIEPITVESVLGLSRYYIENLSEILSEAVGEVYEFLRPPGSHFKTNTEYELKRRVVLENWVEPWSFAPSRLHPSFYYRPRFVALENVFSALDGKGGTLKHHYSDLETAIYKSASGETTYFKYRAFKKRTLHLTFKRPDLVLKFNQIAGGRRLKPTHDT